MAWRDTVASVDPSRAWVMCNCEEYSDGADRRESAQDKQTKPVLVPSPLLQGVGTALEPRQRIVQICLGSEHGILLTDAGIACTWGDNRYGQLGRRPCSKEEDNQPYPVLDLQDEEITHVAAGRHHCLALTAAGLVWAWGRNKNGQLGCGGFRDKVYPERVVLPHRHDEKPKQFGSGDARPKGGLAPQSIICIGAGGNSSVAASMNSDVWQWGAISEFFFEAGDEKTKETKKSQKKKVQTDYPHLVFDSKRFRSDLRNCSISRVACRVTKDEDTPRLRDLVESAKQLQDAIHRERDEIKDLQPTQELHEERSKSVGETEREQRSLQETCAMIELKIAQIELKIESESKNRKNCEDQQAAVRNQIHGLMNTITTQHNFLHSLASNAPGPTTTEQIALTTTTIKKCEDERTDKLGLQATHAKKMRDCKRKLEQLRNERTALVRKLDTVKDLKKSVSSGSGSSDKLINFLRDKTAEIASSSSAGGKTNDDPYLDSKLRNFNYQNKHSQILEDAKGYLSRTPDKQRAERVKLLLQDIIDLKQRWRSLSDDQHYASDLEMAGLFD
eukprot:TRINITY_DN11123_c0_g1_i1.p1 TRINITY_DN11123_c0_g1~~TRINITY_DN11123_c0_g1_i1.p1  ORF type:complete len:577 (+),score=84.60 TRINITY_DN11123_c0_g1_i1:52-1731(+)